MLLNLTIINVDVKVQKSLQKEQKIYFCIIYLAKNLNFQTLLKVIQQYCFNSVTKHHAEVLHRPVSPHPHCQKSLRFHQGFIQ